MPPKPYPDRQIIPEATDRYLRNEIDRQPLDYLKADLIICINALMDMRENGYAPAARTLRELYLSVECGQCGGDGKGLCWNCQGGGTTEHPCRACNNSREQTCQECEGSGRV